MNYYLFSATHRCQPCRMLVDDLNKNFPDWKNYIEYVDVDKATKEQNELAVKLGIMSIPAFTNKDSILKKGYGRASVKEIEDLCTKG